MSENGEEEVTFTAEASVGDVSVSVEADDPEEASDLLDEKLDTAVAKARELGVHDEDKTYHIEGGAGWMVAHGDGDTPEDAFEKWEAMWSRMLEDVEQLSDREREQAGMMR